MGTNDNAINNDKTDNTRVRFSDANWYKAGPLDIVVGGVGGIGSWTSLLLARIGHNLYLHDMDHVDETNMGGQLYTHAQIGHPKVRAAATLIDSFAPGTTVSQEGKYEKEGLVSPIMISCFDNMAARKVMFEEWANYEDRELFIDGRLLAEFGMVFVVTPGNEEKYRETLFDDSEVEEAPCSFKATSHAGAIIGGLIVSTLNNYLENKALNMEVRSLPFKVDFNLPLLSFESTYVKTEENVSV